MLRKLDFGSSYFEGACHHPSSVAQLHSILVASPEATWALSWPSDAPRHAVFFVRGRPYAAVRLLGGRPAPECLLAFFEPFVHRREVGFSLVEVDLPFVLCVLTDAQSETTSEGGLEVAALPAALEEAAASGEDAVFALDGHRLGYAYVRAGRLVRAYVGGEVLREPIELDEVLAQAELGQGTVRHHSPIVVKPDPSMDLSLRDQLAGAALPEAIALEMFEADGRSCTVVRSQERIAIGRRPTADVVLAHRTVGRDQCELHWREDHYDVVDLGSANTTRINGRALQPLVSHPLVPGDELRCGATLVRVKKPGAVELSKTAAALPCSSRWASTGRGRLTSCLVHEGCVTPGVQGEPLRIGAHPRADVRVASSEDPIACWISREPGALPMVNGPIDGRVTVNGRPLRALRMPVSSGDTLEVGGEKIVYAEMLYPGEQERADLELDVDASSSLWA